VRHRAAANKEETDMEITLGSVSSIPMGEGRTFRIGDRHIAVFHGRKGQIFASQADCPHRGGPLADGLLGGNTLVCPLHAWAFDLETGQSNNGQCTLQTYPVRLNTTGHIVVEVSGT
jgi:nitrite reductase (NADH) small subunit